MSSAYPSPHQLSILIIEDHPIVMRGCRRILETRPLTHIHEAPTGAEALRIATQAHLDVALIDLRLPDMEGITLLKQLKGQHPALKCLIFSTDENQLSVSQALEAGAAGYISKSDDPDILVEAVEKVYRGELYLGRSLAMHIATTKPQAPCLSVKTLSPREQQVLVYLSQGLSLYEISQELGVGYRTVAHITARLRQRLGIPGLFGLVKYAVDNSIGRL